MTQSQPQPHQINSVGHNLIDYTSLSLTLFILFIQLYSTQSPAISENLEQKFGPRPIDGVYVEAVQNYSNPVNHHIGFQFGVWPIQPYYNSFSLNFDYTYYFNKSWAWQIIDAAYLYSIDTGLTAELAEKYSLNPKTIQKVTYLLTSNLKWTLGYGKLIVFENHIRYFRSSLITGPALVASNTDTTIGICLGWGFDTFIDEHLSWRFEIRDTIAIGSDHPHNLAFLFGTSYGF